MITNIALKNFKCFRHLEITPRLVTVLIGPNGTGKSGVLQALLLLKQSKHPGLSLDLDGDLLRFAPGDFMLQVPTPAPEAVQLSLSGSGPIEAEGFEDLMKFESHLSYSDNAELVGKRGRTKFRIAGGEREYEILFDGRAGSTTFYTPRGAMWYDEGIGLNDFRVTAHNGGEGDFLKAWERLSKAPTDTLANMRIVPAARALGRGIYPLGPELSVDISSADGLGQQEENIATTLAYSRPDVERVSNLMKRVTGVGFRTDTVPPRSAKPVSVSPAGEFSIVAEGFGTNTLVHLLFELVRANRGATVLIEEPEVHLHPKAQADLASVLVEEAKAANKQVIMTTHSEHVAGRLLTLVAEKHLSPEEISIYSFEKDDFGVCSAHEIEVTDRGQVRGGLKSFFEADLEEMRRYVDALRGGP